MFAASAFLLVIFLSRCPFVIPAAFSLSVGSYYGYNVKIEAYEPSAILFPDKLEAEKKFQQANVINKRIILNHLILEYLDLKCIRALLPSCKRTYHDANSQLKKYMKKRIGFVLSMAEDLIFSAYVAYFSDSRNFELFSGLKGKTINLDDFTGLNLMTSFTLTPIYYKLIFSDWIPNVKSYDAYHFFRGRAGYGAKGCDFPLKLKAFRYLINLVFTDEDSCSSIRMIARNCLPYTLHHLGRIPYYEREYESFVASRLSNLPVSVVDELMQKYPIGLKKSCLLGSLIVNAKCPMKKLKLIFAEMVKFIKPPEEAINPELLPVFNFLQLIPSYELKYKFSGSIQFHSLNLSESFQISEEEFIEIFSDLKPDVLELFFELVPAGLLESKYLALKYLIITDSSSFDEKYFSDNYGDNFEAFSFCYKYFIRNKKEFLEEQILFLVDVAVNKHDLSVPRTDELSCFGDFSPLVDKYGCMRATIITDHLLDRNKSISLFRRVIKKDGENFISSTDYDIIKRHGSRLITSHFDLFLIDWDKKLFGNLVTSETINSTYEFDLAKYLFFNELKYCSELGGIDMRRVVNGIRLRQSCERKTKWTFLQLAILFGRWKLASRILKHPSFDRRSLALKLYGKIDMNKFAEMIDKRDYNNSYFPMINSFIWNNLKRLDLYESFEDNYNPMHMHMQPNIIVSDPAYVFTPSDYQINVEDDACMTDADSRRLYVKVPVTQRLFDRIGQLSSHLVGSQEFPDESFYAFGPQRPHLREYDYLGWHGSDSGMTSIVEEDPFGEGKRELLAPVDKIEFFLSTLQEPENESNIEEFPLFKWYGKCPDGASSVRIYACEKDSEGNYDGLVLRRGEDDLIDNEK